MHRSTGHRSTGPRSFGTSIELTAQEQVAAPPAGMVEVEDIGDVDPALRSGAADAANSVPPVTAEGAREERTAAGGDDCVEIELSAEQIDALLDNPPAR